MLDVGALTIGFARRFATYKRASLLFSDMDRISRLLWDKDRPVQIIFAGKAHPADRPGQGVIQEIFARSRSPQLRGRVFILEDYDMRVARFMVQGVDVWLNNPRRPLEASGTSGMKAAANGVVEPVRPRRLVGRGLGRRQRLGHRRARDEPGRRRPGLCRRAGPLPAPRAGGRAALLRPRRGRRAGGLDGGDAPFHRQHDLAVLDDPDAARVRRADVPACGRGRGQEAGEPPNGHRSGLSRIGRPRLAGSRNPQPSARRQLRLGHRGRLRARLLADARTPWSGTPASGSVSTTPARCCSGWPPTGRRRSTRSAGSWSAARWRSSAAATTSRSWSRCRTATATASWCGCATSSRRCSGGGRAGAWLAERVWEPSLAYDLAAAGYELDRPGRQPPPGRLDPRGRDVDRRSRPTTAASRLTVFGTEQGLRYRIPFKPVEDVISYLRERRPRRTAGSSG